MPNRPNYSCLLDAEIRAFVARCGRSRAVPDGGIAAERAAYRALARDLDPGRPKGLASSDRSFGGVSCRLYNPARIRETPIILYLHGGGFVVGDLDTHDSICAELSHRAGARLVAVDYRLAPEHPHPAQLVDTIAAARAVCRELAAPIIPCGDSAGGTLAAALTHATRGSGLRVPGQVLIYPALGRQTDRDSHIRHSDAPMLTRADMARYIALRFSGRPSPVPDPTAWPLEDPDCTALPPTHVFSAECDPLASDARDYAARLRRHGSPVRLVEERGLVHGYLRARNVSRRAGAAFDRIVAALVTVARSAGT
ncbi:acetyl esterase [Albidovulum inexpectatum]|uniref:Acetyl esterase n=1 Tax=Albidovulum inexpectatum TaxID=196587 RepID=A0A2S5JJD6_9RHOB|nr:alpha/beta hydrolase [Albidovulum inexpectatum]PPB81563.1 acetyl esterase [Albidovulum inexpectatum]